MSHETIANITDAINEQVTQWRNRPLDEVYPIIHTRRDPAADPVTVPRCGLARHLAVGGTSTGSNVLGMWIEATGAYFGRFWTGVMTELRNWWGP